MGEKTDETKDMTDPETDVAIDDESADEVSGGFATPTFRKEHDAKLHGGTTRLHGEGIRAKD
ncbi:MAG: hypothetical protein ACRD0B_11765 [Acidimicrobiales bacterium]